MNNTTESAFNDEQKHKLNKDVRKTENGMDFNQDEYEFVASGDCISLVRKFPKKDDDADWIMSEAGIA